MISLPRHLGLVAATVVVFAGSLAAADKPMPGNRWVEVAKDPTAGRRGGAIRYAADTRGFFLWGYMNHDYEQLQENPLMDVTEHDMVSFDPAVGQWRGHFPKRFEAAWSKKLPPVWLPRTYAGITTGSERSLFRPPPEHPAEASRPDFNIAWDQVAYHPPTKSLVYFTGGLTVAYHVERRTWSNLAPPHSPPPVIAGSLVHDPVNNEILLVGGGNVAEAGPGGRVVGYTSTWAYSFTDKDWRKLKLDAEPPPRMNCRAVGDTKNQVIVVFGGDGQSHFLADTWLYDLKARRWRSSKAPGSPPPRAGHFNVYDPQTGWVIIGGGYNRDNLTDMWAYDAAADRWRKLAGEVPTGFEIAADIAPEKRLLVLTANNKRPGDGHGCNVLYPVRTTHVYRIDGESIALADAPQPQKPMPKRHAEQSGRLDKPDPAREKAQADRLRAMPINQWIALGDPGRSAPVRTWGSATFDSDRGRIVTWGGGHCGYGGSDADYYDIAQNTWISSTETPEYPHRQWDLGVRLAGVTFGGNPWTEHGRRIYAYDPVSRQLIMSHPIRLTTGYEPGTVKSFPGEPRAHAGANVVPPTSYTKYATWGLDSDTGNWTLLGPAPLGLDTLLTTSHGVMAINVDWRTRLNDAGYNLPWKPGDPEEDKSLYLYEAAKKTWKRLGDKQSCPQNLYEMTTLVHDTKRDQIILHGGGSKRDELWAFDLKTNRWTNRQPKVAAPEGAAPPSCNREAVYLPTQDVMLSYGPAPEKGGQPALWVYKPADNTWTRMVLDPPPGVEPRVAAGQNRGLVYDARRDLVLLVIGAGGDKGRALVYAMKYRHDQAKALGK